MTWQGVVVITHVVVVEADNESDARNAILDTVEDGDAGEGKITILSVDELE